MSAILAATAIMLVAGLATSSTASPRHHHRHHHRRHLGGGSTVTVTEADNGTTVTLAVGETLGVELHGTSGFRFTAPVSTSTAILAELGSSADPSTGNARGQFRGEHVGSTELTSIQNPSCYPQCLPPSLLWTVTVDVVPSPVVAGRGPSAAAQTESPTGRRRSATR